MNDMRFMFFLPFLSFLSLAFLLFPLGTRRELGGKMVKKDGSTGRGREKEKRVKDKKKLQARKESNKKLLC